MLQATCRRSSCGPSLSHQLLSRLFVDGLLLLLDELLEVSYSLLQPKRASIAVTCSLKNYLTPPCCLVLHILGASTNNPDLRDLQLH